MYCIEGAEEKFDGIEAAQDPGKAIVRGALIWAALLVLIVSGHALAQMGGAPTTRDAGCDDSFTKNARADTFLFPPAEHSSESKPKASSAPPVPRWNCKQPEINLEPVWPPTLLDCAFEISNTGTAELRIKVKGG